MPGECDGRRSLVGYSPRGRKGSDTTEQISTHALVMTVKIMTPPPTLEDCSYLAWSAH